MSDPLAPFRALVEDVERTRRQLEMARLMTLNQTIRIALWQLDNEPIRYENSDPRWGDILALAESGRITMDHAGTVNLDHRELTEENFGKVAGK
jgi:hypothetical protein